MNMDDTNHTTMDQIKAFLKGSDHVTWRGMNQRVTHQWIQSTLIKFQYLRESKKNKGCIKQYIQTITGYSRAQITRYITQYRKTGRVIKKKYTRSTFSKIYTKKDVQLLAKTDKLHQLSGPAIKRILEREVAAGHTQYNHIANISISHLYNLRQSYWYRMHHRHISKTIPVNRQIGKREKPRPNGQPGFIRIDTVHQSGLDGKKGIYHINAVDEVTQWNVIVCVEKISEQCMIPALRSIIEQFPVRVQAVHSDNGSEFINHAVYKQLSTLTIRLTKSRPRTSNDNALVECKNGHIVRKQFGHGYIPNGHASTLNVFNQSFLNRYINFHRPCFFPVETMNQTGKIRKTYPYSSIQTPCERLLAIPNVASFLKPHISVDRLRATASEFSDNQFAELLLRAKESMWQTIFPCI